MALGRQVFSSVQIALRKQVQSVTANQTWLKLHAELAIGIRQGGIILLSRSDRDDLRRFVIDNTGFDPLFQQIDGDRIEVAARTANEKLSSHAVFGNEVKISRNERPIELIQGLARTPYGTYLSTSPDNIDLKAIETIVVVENGAAFRQWSKVHMEDAFLQESLTLYRGHDQSARAVMDLLDKARESVKIYAAVDFDPAGFRIALYLNADGILIPKDYEKLLLEKHLNKPEIFAKQNDTKCNELIPHGWRKTWEWLHANRIAITQEALLSRGWPVGMLEK